MQASGAERVLEALGRTEGEPCSGAGLSEQLQVSRSQIWKHVEALRAKGYGIEGSPGGGYRLVSVPDRLYPEEIQAGLETRWMARNIHYFDSIDSTNRVGFDLAREGAAHGTAVIAEAQTAGRGRLGRSFYSPPHRNLYTSVVLRPSLSASAAATVILAAAIAVAETAAESLRSPGAVEIKWPNDVLLDGLKTSGILMELSAEATRVGFLVLGIFGVCPVKEGSRLAFMLSFGEFDIVGPASLDEFQLRHDALPPFAAEPPHVRPPTHE